MLIVQICGDFNHTRATVWISAQYLYRSGSCVVRSILLSLVKKKNNNNRKRDARVGIYVVVVG